MTSTNKGQIELNLLEEIAGTVRELLAYARVGVYPSIAQTLSTVLDSPEKLQVYDAMDGLRGVRDIQKLTKVNRNVVSAWGRQWERIGIVGQSRTAKIKGRREKLFDLSLFGLASASEGIAKRDDE